MNKISWHKDYPNVQAIWVKSEENVRFISGFTGDSSTLLLVDNEVYLLTDSRYIEQARMECPECIVIDYNGNLYSLIYDILLKHQAASLGMEYSYISHEEFCKIKNHLNGMTDVNVSLDSYRMIKSEYEINNMRKAAQIACDALSDILIDIKCDKTENELRVTLESAMLRRGSEKTAFDTIVASGKRSALPHGLATDKKIEYGDFVTFDFGAVYQGYRSDITRTFIIGEASEYQRFLYDAVLNTQLACTDMIKPGSISHEIDDHAREMLSEYDLEQYFTHSLGHGVGLNVHELPRVSRNDDTELVCNMVVTVEPGVYIPDFGGLRIEDTVVVGKNGPEILTVFPKQLYEIKNGGCI